MEQMGRYDICKNFFLVVLFSHPMIFYALVEKNPTNIKLLAKFLIFELIDGGLPPL